MWQRKAQMSIGEPQAAVNADALERLQEAVWVVRAQKGDPDAFAWLMARHERPLLYYLRRFIVQPEAALDAQQEVWLDVFRGLPALRAPAAFRAWLYRLAHGKAVRFLRAELRNSKTEELPGDLPEAPLTPLPEDAEAIHHALELLSAPHREVLTLHYLRDLTLEEIATATACSVGTVKSRLHYARLAMRQHLEGELHE